MRTALLHALMLPLAAMAACPGSPSSVHASCEMTVTFPSNSCHQVKEEMVARINGDKNWVDPHNQGTYTLVANDNDTVIRGSRQTGDGKYTDLFEFGFTSNDDDSSCVVQACSESQVFSILDFSTNYCNLYSLYCNSTESCPTVHYDLTYSEEYTSCWQRSKENCMVLLETVSV